MFATILAPRLQRHGMHYGWVMVAVTFLTTVSTSAAISLPGVLILPLASEFGWRRTDIAGAIALMLITFGGMAPFAGALMLRLGLRRVVVIAALIAAATLLATTQVTTRWQLWLSLGGFLGLTAGTTGLRSPPP
jgi:MFS family permease